MSPRAGIGLSLAFCGSLALHGVAYGSLHPGRDRAPRPDFVSQVSIEVKARPVATPLAPPTPPPPPASPAGKRTEPRLKAAPRPALVPESPPAPRNTASAAALDLSGVTLTNESGSGFTVPVGDGGPLRDAFGLAPQRAEAPVQASAVPRTAASGLVPASDLSEHPVPPALAGLLRANYPDEARLRGLRGSAKVRARIDPDGVARSARLVIETAAGFGAACRRTVLGSHWSPPRDKSGRAVATEIVYICQFEVDQ